MLTQVKIRFSDWFAEQSYLVVDANTFVNTYYVSFTKLNNSNNNTVNRAYTPKTYWIGIIFSFNN